MKITRLQHLIALHISAESSELGERAQLMGMRRLKGSSISEAAVSSPRANDPKTLTSQAGSTARILSIIFDKSTRHSGAFVSRLCRRAITMILGYHGPEGVVHWEGFPGVPHI